VGSAPHLRPALGGTPVDIDAQAGRTSGQGVRVLARRLETRHDVVVFPLGTNDTSADASAANLAAARQLAGERCIVVATIARPPLRGASAAALNRLVARFAPRGAAQVADWRSDAAATPGALGRDGTHATGQGYALRASLLAEAVQGCLVGGGRRHPGAGGSGRAAARGAAAGARAAGEAAVAGGRGDAGGGGPAHGDARARGAARRPNSGNQSEPEPVVGAP
jgi:hypothetical protein